ncbi:MAG: 5-formyltetrahydrofolate cyclo-ligase [Vagococcus sp.]|uniref:5-formyltetrahydrofolate cyclo-ligase n=1 Tax=Vagococcus sp. TaxID=1933889 RepID=UPI002FC6B4A5
MKKEIRKDVLNKLYNLSQKTSEKATKESNILAQLFESDSWKEAHVVGTTLAMPKEFNTGPLIKQAIEEGKIIVVPRTFGLGKMEFYYYDFSEKLEETSFGVLEPTNDRKFGKDEIDLIIVPGVAFSPEGYRVGFGGGFYDRYLEAFKGNTCSLVLPEQTGYSWKPEDHDLPVNRLFYFKETGVI